MSVNLMDLVKGQLTSSVVGKIGGLLGESESATSSAIGKVIPSILGGLMSKTGSSAGASQIFDLLSKGGHDGSIFNDLGGLLAGGDKTNGLMDSGSNLANAIFGNKTNSMMDMVGKAIGFGNRSSSSLVSLLLPMVMGMIGKVGKEKNLDAGGIASLLSSQKDHIVGHAPAGLFESLGLGGLVGGAIGGVKNIAGGVTDAGSKVVGGTMDAGKKVVGGTMDAGKKVVGGVTDAGSKVVGGTMDAGKKVVGGVADAGGKVVGGVADAGGAAVNAGGSILKKIIPLLLLGLLGFLGWTFLGKGCSGAKDAVGGVTQTVTDGAKGAAGAVSDGAGKLVDGTKNVAGKAADAAGNVVNKAGEGVKGAAGAAAGAAKSMVNKGADFFKFAKGSTEAAFADFLTNPKADISKSFVLDKVEFEIGSANLKQTSRAQLDGVAKILKEYGSVNVELQGHTDNTGNAAKNQTLSGQRAKAVLTYLTTKGIKANRMGSKGYGSDKPRAKNDTKEGRQKNRRTEIKVTKR